MSARKSTATETAAIDMFVDIALSEAQREFGKEKCYIAAEHEIRQRVLPIPHIALRWLIESNGWPLSRWTQSGGPFGTSKSSFCYQLEAWYLEAGAFACHIDTENKTSSSLMRSIIPPQYFDPTNPLSRRLQFRNATSVNEWQQMVWQQFKLLNDLSATTGQKNMFPAILAIDSLKGSHGQEAITHLETEGEAMGRGFSDAALLINNFLGTFPNKILGWPVTLHSTNHEKPAMGIPGLTRSGGRAPDFYATLDIRFKRGGQSALRKSDEFDWKNIRGKNITMLIRKSSMGSDIDKRLVVPFLWTYVLDEATGQQRQVSWWDWHTATAWVLKNQASDLKSVMDLDSYTKQATANDIGGDQFWSEALGVPKSQAMPAAEFGKMVESHTLRPVIESALHVEQHPVFEAGVEL